MTFSRQTPTRAGTLLELDPRVQLASLAHPGLNSAAATRLVEHLLLGVGCLPLLSTVCSLPFAVCCLPFAVCCLLSTVCCLLFTVYCLLFTVFFLYVTTNCL